MTPSEHAALSAELARALGWRVAHSDFRLDRGVLVIDPAYPLGDFRWFDYRRSDVCLPLIEWLMAEHDVLPVYAAHTNPFFKRYAMLRTGDDETEQIDAWGDTLPEAVARAVIAVKGR